MTTSWRDSLQNRVLFSARFTTISFLGYFLLLTYVYPSIENPTVAWTSLVVPSVLMLIALVIPLSYERHLDAISVRERIFFDDWQWLFIASAFLSLTASTIKLAPLEALSFFVLCLLFVVLSRTGGTIPVPKYLPHLVCICIAGSVASYHLEMQKFGYLPWHEASNPTFAGVSRVSFFPFVAESAIFATLVLLVVIALRGSVFWLVIPVGYFAFQSYSRTVWLVLLAVLLSEFLCRFVKIRGTINFVIIVSFVAFLGGFSERIIPAAAEFEKSLFGQSFIEDRFMRRLVLRENDGSLFSADDERQQLEWTNPHLGARASLWRDHVSAFMTSPLTGVGRENAAQAVTTTSYSSSISGTESFFTRILAEFGFAALFFWAAVWRLFVHSDQRNNALARMLTLTFVVVGMLYGSGVTPYNFVTLFHFVLLGYALRHSKPASPTEVSKPAV